MFAETEKFNNDVIGIQRNPGTISDDKEFNWFIGVILEELQELQDAHGKKDFIAEIDSIMDLLYFAAGGMARMGIDSSVSQEIFLAVHEANMNKAKGKKKERIASHDLDAIKPKGWESPEIKIIDILENNYGNR